MAAYDLIGIDDRVQLDLFSTYATRATKREAVSRSPNWGAPVFKALETRDFFGRIPCNRNREFMSRNSEPICKSREPPIALARSRVPRAKSLLQSRRT